MKHLKNLTACFAAVLTLTTAALAASVYETPAEAATGVTGKTLEEVIAERQSGISYGAIAAGAGALEEFQAAVQELWEEALESRVAEGTLTQEQADARLEAIRQRQEACGGTGGCGLGGMGCGMGAGRGWGRNGGCGFGMGLRNGFCIYS